MRGVGGRWPEEGLVLRAPPLCSPGPLSSLKFILSNSRPQGSAGRQGPSVLECFSWKHVIQTLPPPHTPPLGIGKLRSEGTRDLPGILIHSHPWLEALR